MTGLFKQGYQNTAANLLLPQSGGYSYLKNIPYYSQAFPYNKATTSLAENYLEGVAMAQTVIKGLFGLETTASETKFAPHVPASLLSSGPVSLIGLKSQRHVWDISVKSASNHDLKVRLGSSGQSTFRLGYKLNGTLTLTVSNLLANKSFTVAASPLSGTSPVTTMTVNSDSSGILTTTLQLNGDNIITVQLPSAVTTTPRPSPTAIGPTKTPTRTPTPVGQPATTIKIFPMEDTFVNANTPGQNYCLNQLQADGSPVKITYLKFDLRNLNTTINSASLFLRITNSSPAIFRVRQVSSNAWTECNMTYNNRPTLGSAVASFIGGTAGNWKSVDISSHVRYKKGTIATMAIDTSGADDLIFYSRENSTYKPYIELNGSSTGTLSTQ
ncbi:hypothetical protein A2W14_04230 [Candidatus Gottesmanbacteria bacterium RBG_16_37_8]|uniref:Carbohydrate-binding module family 96 domain-containing protein n=1 Tax=Candidatus Gottesmanbacteria bacterium RBG_16_37_8 TaxID=1798371 RepID=A0A1F5YPV1_9BACT|nr:MAG: hypothetical protein A2W14_04230 [Candidatus Gottesmanbacteria bacterium RBG_16_37_8]